jgi:hypothetical protein
LCVSIDYAHGLEIELVAIPVTDVDRAKAFTSNRLVSMPTTTIR